MDGQGDQDLDGKSNGTRDNADRPRDLLEASLAAAVGTASTSGRHWLRRKPSSMRPDRGLLPSRRSSPLRKPGQGARGFEVLSARACDRARRKVSGGAAAGAARRADADALGRRPGHRALDRVEDRGAGRPDRRRRGGGPALCGYRSERDRRLVDLALLHGLHAGAASPGDPPRQAEHHDATSSSRTSRTGSASPSSSRSISITGGRISIWRRRSRWCGGSMRPARA